MSSRSLTEILLATRPELAAHLEQQAAEMSAKRRNSNPERRNRPERRLTTVAR
jgi:hypothetical protein